MAASGTVPLYLFQVLEQEYAALHGEELQTWNWRFEPTHIRASTLLLFVSALTPHEAETASSGLDPDRAAAHKLHEYLQQKLQQNTDLAKRLREAPDTQVVAEVLNLFLDDPDLFSEDRFSQYWLNTATRNLRDVRNSLSDEERQHFNRLLLEDAFPAVVQKIHRIRLGAIYERMHAKKQTALCLSGGGIRSGTFALGVLQGLARHELLDQFHYLSTVSGGGYIGSWLSAWIHRHKRGLKGVTEELANTKPPTTVDPDPPPIRYLRRYSSFLTPKVGLLSADTWTFIAIYLRNLLLNWIVLIPLLLGLLTLPRIIVSLTIAPTKQTDPWFVIPTPRGDFGIYARHVFLIAGLALLVWAVSYIMFNRPTVREELRDSSTFWRRHSTQGSFQWFCLLPLVFSAFCLTTYWAWSSQNGQLPKAWYWFAVFGLLTTFLAWLVSSFVIGRFRLLSFELVYLLATGLVGGLLLWVVTYSFNPFGGAELWVCDQVASKWSLDTWTAEIYACLATPAFLLIVLLGATIYVGLSSVSRRVDDEDREWWARLGAWVLIVILSWTVFTTVVIFGPVALLSAPTLLGSIGTLAGILAAAAGRSSKTSAAPKTPAAENSAKSSLVGLIVGKGLPLLAAIFIGFLLVVLSTATTEIARLLAYKWPDVVSRYTTYPSLRIDNFLDCIYRTGGGSWVHAKLAHMTIIHLTSFWFVLVLGAALFVIGLVISFLINLNLFSLHAGYRNRLIRAFLGASRPNHERKPNPFTGFDPADNVSMHELRPGLFVEDDFPRAVDLANVLLNYDDPKLVEVYPVGVKIAEHLDKRDLLPSLRSVIYPYAFSLKLLAALRRDLNAVLRDPDLVSAVSADVANAATQSVNGRGDIYLNRAILEKAFLPLIRPRQLNEPYRLLHVINTTLNLVAGDNLAWQQRKAEPFSVSPLYSGCFRLGYRDSRFYGGRDSGGISIGTAAAISGAAASSNMGYYTTSPVLSLVLTFFNVRLGWWLGNPGTAGNSTYDLRAPKSSVQPVVDEALGLTDDKNKYVYLTDGGHFDNLGLYEMVLRRCHVIVVSDAAADSEYRFTDLGNAIRKIRIDLGVPIEFTSIPIFASQADQTRKGMYWAVGVIRYSCIDTGAKDGCLLYIKPAIYGNEPRDVLEYKKSHPTFPHQSTADQFFDEPQFESYRVLGSHIMDQMCGPQHGVPVSLNQAISNAVAKLLANDGGAPADPELQAWWNEWSCSCEK